MNRIAVILPPVCVTVYISLGQSQGFSSGLMRPLTLGLGLVLLAVLWRPARSGALAPPSAALTTYLGLALLSWWAWPSGAGAFLGRWPVTVLYFVLLGMASLPQLLGREPFTTWFARQRTPEAVQASQQFKTINLHMSWAWAGLFALAAVSSALPVLLPSLANLPGYLVFQAAIPVALMLGVGVRLNKKYPDYYLARQGLGPLGEGAPAGLESKEEENQMTEKLKVVAINGSPHVRIGNTDMMLEMIGQVLAENGAELEQVHLAEKHLEFCTGCGVCLEKGKCWRLDDHAGIMQKILAADAVILASPVYFRNVTGQMKTFLDRSLAYGHKPRSTWKPGLAVSVSAGWGETWVVEYLAGVLKAFGVQSVGTLSAIAVSPGGFLGKEHVEARARHLAEYLVRAIREDLRMPATDEGLSFWLFMGYLVKQNADFMVDDDRHWREHGFYESFENYVGQSFAEPLSRDPEMRKEWIRQMIAEEKKRASGRPAAPPRQEKPQADPAQGGARMATSCHQLISMMPLAFKAEAAGDMAAVIQFEVSGDEEFTAQLVIKAGKCVFIDGATEPATLTIKTPADVWLGISQGKLDGQQQFMTGKYKAEGDLTVLMRLSQMFGG